MGTSTSSKGGSAGSPFDPAWLDSPEGAGPTGGSDLVDPDPAQAALGEAGDEAAATTGNDGAAAGAERPGEEGAAFAPDRRFAAARAKMSSFLAGGGREALRGAARNMVNRGMGGPRRAASTMRRTASGAGQLGQFLAAARDGTDQRVVDWVERVRAANLSADDLVLELIREVLPDTGSVDEESLRNSAAEALGQLYEAHPDLDLLNLTNQQIAEVVGFTVGNDVCTRMDLLLGQTYEKLRLDPQQVQVYRNDVREFVRAEVRVVLDRVGATNIDPQRLAKQVLESTLKVFAE
jgi:hypothetical protein